MASKREQVLEAVKALVATAVAAAADVERNQAKPERVESKSLIIIRDGDPGDPEIDLSPYRKNYSHRIPLEIAALSETPEGRFEALDALMRPIGAAVLANPTLGGLCDFLEVEAPDTGDEEAPGTEATRWADLEIVAHYATTDPLN